MAKAKAKAKMQRRFVTGSEYVVEGVTEKERKLKFVGRMTLGEGEQKKEYLIFQPRRKASKQVPNRSITKL